MATDREPILYEIAQVHDALLCDENGVLTDMAITPEAITNISAQVTARRLQGIKPTFNLRDQGGKVVASGDPLVNMAPKTKLLHR